MCRVETKVQVNLAEENHHYLSIQKAEKGGSEEGGREEGPQSSSDGFTEITARFSLIIKCLGFLCATSRPTNRALLSEE